MRRLAKLVHHQEVENVKIVNFKSEDEQRKIHERNQSLLHIGLELLDSGEQIKRDYEQDETRSPIAHKIFSGAEWTINTSFQCVCNCILQRNCLTKVTEYSKRLIHILHNLDPQDTSSVLKLFIDCRCKGIRESYSRVCHQAFKSCFFPISPTGSRTNTSSSRAYL
ncbi:hypothetical protein FEM48_Zijuj01G0181800 [Ziziphus jujuba var. spinosa]|uniref:Uncharacterized protein n=1 Tax=Ziziphus jujuba var. spinosa TaxID=714518 RepID=A0A978W2T0_ZIZJJ|nr:hypothetical protein FEM48_Zijuj01G0181800 [Ziziphus jujuba var. spinosa]